MNGAQTKPGTTLESSAQAWLRALELTAPIPRNRHRTMPVAVEEFAARSGDAPALLSDDECLTYKELAARKGKYAGWALEQGIQKGDVVGLLMTNSPDYLAIWLGISSIGAVTALLNTNLSGHSLAHCINVVKASHVITSADCVNRLESCVADIKTPTSIWVHGADHDRFSRIDRDIASRHEDLKTEQNCYPTIEDDALYIFTSGTTGLPKAARVSHARLLQWGLWFAGMLDVQPSDRMYNCLPMYHSIGGVLAPCAMLVGGGSTFVGKRFSASKFWSDVLRWDCTMFQYIGEMCRYLLHASSHSDGSGHHLRVACGNGMAHGIWDEFKERFGIPRILEFYASSEGGVSLFNVEGERGAIGRVPPYLVHRFSPALALVNRETGELVRGEDGLCIRCAQNEVGEALGKIVDDPSAIGDRFEGYTDGKASEKKILHNVFRTGDAWVRTGDLMRRDERGFFYFVDRIGDTFRWKGENVATSEVSEVLCTFPGVKHASVYGVTIPETEGRAGMAAVVADHSVDLEALRKHLITRLPKYARPIFLRIRDEMQITGTFKYTKHELVRQGYDPESAKDRLYFDHPGSGVFVALDRNLYAQIQGGQIRL